MASQGHLIAYTSENCKYCPQFIRIQLPMVRNQFPNLKIHHYHQENGKKIVVDGNSPIISARQTPTTWFVSDENYRSNYQLANEDCFNARKDKNGFFGGTEAPKYAPTETLVSWLSKKIATLNNSQILSPYVEGINEEIGNKVELISIYETGQFSVIRPNIEKDGT